MTPVFAIIDGPIVAIIVGLAVLLFGADKIPKLARSMGEAKKEFESASRGEPPPPADSAAVPEKPADPKPQTPAQS
jgi:sec-independent protein translocase protein TatA